MADPPPEQTRPAADEPKVVDSSAAAVSQPVADDDDEDIKSKRVSLADLSAKGSALYAHKNYDEASEIFSRASVLQAEINGELHPENAEILFHYGRSLFKVGQSKSDVLGGPAAADKRAAVDANGSSKAHAATAAQVQLADVGEVKDAKPEAAKEAAAGADTGAKKPLFQFTGDENFDNSDAEEEDEGADDEGQEEEDDDLATAFEILDLARVCYLRKLEKLSSENQSAKERLADTHDCLAEISLENEQYPNAIEDGRVSLKYKMELYPEDSEIVAEAHYKLSLALEFASITMSGDDGTNAKREAMDQDLRDEAVKEMDLAITSFKLKMQAKEVDLATMASPEDNDVARKVLAEMKEVVADMEQRLVDLRKDPIDADALGGILGSALGQPPSAEVQARADEAAKNATDLTGMVRKKAKDAAPNGKRKADELAADDAPVAAAAAADEGAPASPKKPRLADGDAGDKA
ncbi:SHNi-TPR domain-containing protein [Hirsutella rhossiliensis]|uniref:SHNi-TPR domain-containing protein n=1 Tax=Hirsutella rhossiliensis TaxID=111463 RepID=A0A9P8NAA4_9HYPO|nr:SHNi-TPR domain-containing protein [Hirsutella rhossiliensis]KAH0967482.1 SHNi-TPR domain-containing protein [Hirsutella rhossiliensis]